MINHITRPTECVSRKETWAEDRRARFEAELLEYGWVKRQIEGERFLGRQMPNERRFVKGNKALMVDDFGAFAYEFIVNPNYLDGAVTGTWRRVHGISDDLIDASPEGFLWFYNGEKLDLRSGMWEK